MALSQHLYEDEIHPIDLVEHLAEYHAWDFDRTGDDQITMFVEGQWRSYSVTVAWSGRDEALRMVCTFEMDPADDKLPQLYELLNLVNDQCWTGAFTYWADQKLMVYRYGLVLSGGQEVGSGQVDAMIKSAVNNAERYYPALQLLLWGGCPPRDALKVAIAEAYGRA